MSNNQSVRNTNSPALDVKTQISQILETLRFGSITIIVHDSKVVEIERREKFRPQNGQ